MNTKGFRMLSGVVMVLFILGGLVFASAQAQDQDPMVSLGEDPGLCDLPCTRNGFYRTGFVGESNQRGLSGRARGSLWQP